MVGLPLPAFWQPMQAPVNFAVTQLVLTLPVLYWGRQFFIVGFKALFNGHPNMDSLVALGTSAAWGYSLIATLAIISGHIDLVTSLYYESASVILTLITLGKYFEARSKGQTSSAIEKLLNLAPNKQQFYAMASKQRLMWPKWSSATCLLSVLVRKYQLTEN